MRSSLERWGPRKDSFRMNWRIITAHQATTVDNEIAPVEIIDYRASSCTRENVALFLSDTSSMEQNDGRENILWYISTSFLMRVVWEFSTRKEKTDNLMLMQLCLSIGWKIRIRFIMKLVLLQNSICNQF